MSFQALGRSVRSGSRLVARRAVANSARTARAQVALAAQRQTRGISVALQHPRWPRYVDVILQSVITQG
jgi:hypothetical protein